MNEKRIENFITSDLLNPMIILTNFEPTINKIYRKKDASKGYD